MQFRYKINKFLGIFSVIIQEYDDNKNKWKKFDKTYLENICNKLCPFGSFSYEPTYGEIVNNIKFYITVDDFMTAYIKKVLSNKKYNREKQENNYDAYKFLNSIASSGWNIITIKDGDNDG